MAQLWLNRPDPRPDLTAALRALRTIREHAIHLDNAAEYMYLSEAADNVEAFIYAHATPEEMHDHLERVRATEDWSK